MAATPVIFLSVLISTLSPAGAQADPGSKPEQPAIIARPAKIELEVEDAPIDADSHRLEIEAGTTASGNGLTGATIAVRGDKKLILAGDNSFRRSPGVVLNLGGDARADMKVSEHSERNELTRLRLRLPGISLLTGQTPDAAWVDSHARQPSFAGEFSLLRVGGIYDDDEVTGEKAAGVDLAVLNGGVQKSFSIAGLPMDVCFMAEPGRFIIGSVGAAEEETGGAYKPTAEVCAGARLGEVVEIRDSASIEGNVAMSERDSDGDDKDDSLAFKGVGVRNRLSVNTRLSKDVTMSTAWTYERSQASSARGTETTTNRHLFTVGVGF